MLRLIVRIISFTLVVLPMALIAIFAAALNTPMLRLRHLNSNTLYTKLSKHGKMKVDCLRSANLLPTHGLQVFNLVRWRRNCKVVSAILGVNIKSNKEFNKWITEHLELSATATFTA